MGERLNGSPSFAYYFNAVTVILFMKIVSTILALTIFIPALAQNACDERYVFSVSNSNFKALPYNAKAVFHNTSTGKYFGCGDAAGGKLCELAITKAFYDANNCEITMEGFFYFYGLTGKQQPFDYSIFLAEPRRNESGPFLWNIRKLADIASREYDNGNIASSYGDGYFKIKFSFTASDRLYFDAGQHVYLTEYSVGCLLQGNKFRQEEHVR